MSDVKTQVSVDRQSPTDRPSMSGTRYINYILPIVFLVLILFIYGPIFVSLIKTLVSDSDSSHGLLVLPISAYLAWRKRSSIADLPRRRSIGALVLVVIGALFLPLSKAASIEGLAYISLVLVLGGAIWHIWGTRTMRVLLFPYLFLAFAIPWPGLLIETITFPMQLISARLATLGVNLFGFQALRDGVQISMGNSHYTVDAPCSGMHSMAALMAMGALLAYIVKGSLFRRVLLFALVPPLAIAGNIVRIVTILLLALHWPVFAEPESTPHKATGMVVYLVALGLLVVLSRVLRLHQVREVL